MLPKTWLKYGELFIDDNHRTVFVCSDCLKYNNMFCSYKITDFWEHIKSFHKEELIRNCVAIEHLKRRHKKELLKRRNESETIFIDISDDDDDSRNHAAANDADMTNNENNTKPNEVSADDDDVFAVDTDFEEVNTRALKRKRTNSTYSTTSSKVNRSISMGQVNDDKSDHRNNVEGSEDNEYNINSGGELSEKDKAILAEIDGSERLNNDPMPIVSDDDDDNERNYESETEPEWTNRVSLMLRDKIHMKLMAKTENIEEINTQTKCDEIYKQLNKPIIMYIKEEMPDNEINDELIEPVVEQAVHEVMDDEIVECNDDDLKLESEIAKAVHEPPPQYLHAYTRIPPTSALIPMVELHCGLLQQQQQREHQQNNFVEYQQNCENEYFAKFGMWQCMICKKNTKTDHGLIMHKIIKHGIRHLNPTYYPCPNCDKRYKWKHSLCRHLLKIHSIDAQYQRDSHSTIPQASITNRPNMKTSMNQPFHSYTIIDNDSDIKARISLNNNIRHYNHNISII